MTSFVARLPVPAFLRGSLFNQAGRAGPARLALIAGGGVSIIVLGVALSLMGHGRAPNAHVARMPYVDPLPGGLQSNPEVDAVALKAAQDSANSALKKGNSYTPPIAASVHMEQPKIVETVSPSEVGLNALAQPRPHPVVAVAPAPVRVPPAYRPIDPPIQKVAATEPSPAEQAYAKDLFQNWGGRMPRTDVVLPPATEDDQPAGTAPADKPARAPANPTATRASVVSDASPSDEGQVLVPAGRGIYAHTILAVNSDTGGPLVLQADSGPIAGDRMIATFNKNTYDRLVVRVTTIEHHGKSIDANGIVVAPDTLETAVASSVDEHYLERFILPAAAAFIQGLGQAIATTSNTQTVLSPFGGAAYSTNLNIRQQLGVAAGAAASQVGTALNQEAPKGPTINVDANANVGVMFLSNLTLPSK
jgi:intracellular multiplication protein IcmE